MTLVNEALLFGGYVATPSNEILKELTTESTEVYMKKLELLEETLMLTLTPLDFSTTLSPLMSFGEVCQCDNLAVIELRPTVKRIVTLKYVRRVSLFGPQVH